MPSINFNFLSNSYSYYVTIWSGCYFGKRTESHRTKSHKTPRTESHRTKSHNLCFTLADKKSQDKKSQLIFLLNMYISRTKNHNIYIYTLIHVSYVGRTKSLILKATPCRNCATVFLPEKRSLHWFCSRFCNSTCFWLILFVGCVPMVFCCITVVTVACSRWNHSD